uniref:Tetratricopeptide repeat protein n=1 Tax=viral metagenome TaxID=1070528 RepID=A0A6M3KI96_9ZZZZ
MNKQMFNEAFVHSLRALCLHNGRMRLWNLWSNLGAASLALSAVEVAKLCYMQSLALWPKNKEVATTLMQLQKLKSNKLEVQANANKRSNG